MVTHCRLAGLGLGILLTLGASASDTRAATPGDPLRDRLAAELLELTPDEGRPAPGRELFATVLGGDDFLHEAVGSLDLYVHVADGLDKPNKAKKVLARAVEGLTPLADALERHFPEGDDLIAGQRFPIVLVDSDTDDDEQAFDRLLALLDQCEDGDFSGFKPDLGVFTAENRTRSEVFTWEVLVCNIAHQDITEQDKKWFGHGIGYSTINMLVNRLFAKGAWGPPPPWLKDGLVDELDIAAYGEAWIAAGESVQASSSTKGWSRAGWSGFVPKGSSPPPPIMGPPPGLKTKFQKTVVSDKWMARKKSKTRHWSDLAKDLKSDVPVSFRHMAAGQSFEKRDRAYARCVMHLMLGLEDGSGGALLDGLGTECRIGKGGMRTADPLPSIFASALGGIPAVDELEALPMSDFLASIGRAELIGSIERLGGGGMLDIADHRKQAAWLYHQKLKDRDRQSLYRLIIEVENYQQLQAWEILGDSLDRAARAALSASKSYPAKARQRDLVELAFQDALVPEADRDHELPAAQAGDDLADRKRRSDRKERQDRKSRIDR